MNIPKYIIFALLLALPACMASSPSNPYIIDVLTTKEEHKKDALLQAIVNRDLAKVTEHAKKTDLNGEPFQSIIDGAFMDKLRKENRIKRNDPIDSIYTGHTYLSVAILISTQDKTEADKQASFAVIKELLANKANAQYPKNANHQTYGLGGAFMIREKRGQKDVLIPYEYFYPLIFEAVDRNCRPEILEELFAHGADAHATIDGVQEKTLLAFAQEKKATALIPVIEKWQKLAKAKK